METLWQSLGYTLRVLAKSTVFTTVATLSLERPSFRSPRCDGTRKLLFLSSISTAMGASDRANR